MDERYTQSAKPAGDENEQNVERKKGQDFPPQSCWNKETLLTLDEKSILLKWTFSSFAPSLSTFFFPLLRGSAEPSDRQTLKVKGQRSTDGLQDPLPRWRMKKKKARRIGRGKKTRTLNTWSLRGEKVSDKMNNKTLRNMKLSNSWIIQELNACYKFTENLLLRRFKG